MMECLLVGKGRHQLEAVGYLSRQTVVLGSSACRPLGGYCHVSLLIGITAVSWLQPFVLFA
jgi:hypothetical protein